MWLVIHIPLKVNLSTVRSVWEVTQRTYITIISQLGLFPTIVVALLFDRCVQLLAQDLQVYWWRFLLLLKQSGSLLYTKRRLLDLNNLFCAFWKIVLYFLIWMLTILCVLLLLSYSFIWGGISIESSWIFLPSSMLFLLNVHLKI